MVPLWCNLIILVGVGRHSDGSPPYKMRYFRPISGFISETIHDKAIVSMERPTYAIYRIVTLPMNLSDLWRSLQAQEPFQGQYLEKHSI